ncbi:MAG: polyprenyl synthetase family protein [Planktomarina sp.]
MSYFPVRLAAAAVATQAVLAGRIVGYADLPMVHGMQYAVTGGKGLRGFLVMEAAALYGVNPQSSAHAGAAIEALHAYSLVHDDLPCMDDDDLRRGLPTVHKKWDDATAVLVGDALQTLAFDLLADPVTHADPAVRIALVSSLAKASGAEGMVLGQAQDIAAETAAAPLTLDQISELQKNKTGALIEWSAQAGALLAQEDPTPLRHYAQCLGLAFQIADDILDVEGDAAEVGKATGKDADAGKATFVSLLGLDVAKARARELTEQAADALVPFGAKADVLKAAATFVVDRKK